MFLSQQIQQIFADISIVLLVCGLILAAWFGETLNNKQYISASHTAAQDQLGTIRNRLQGNLYGDMQLIKGLVSVIAADPKLDQAHFARAAKPLFDGGTNLRNIGAAPNMVISMMYPVAGNEKAIGLDFRKTPSQFEMAEKARTHEKVILAGPLTLAQGGQGIIGRIPVFTEDQSGKRQFWGLISAVIDADKLYRNSGLLDKNSTLEIAIRGKDGTGSKGPVFFGRAELFDSNPAITEILLPVGSWQIAAVPRNGWPSQAGNIWTFRLISLLIILLITLPFVALRRSLVALRESESRFRQMFEKHSAVMLLIDPESGQIVDANSAAALFYGYSLESLRGMNISHINTLPEEKIKELIHQAHKESRNYFLFEHHLADGSIRPVEVYSSTMNTNKRDLLFSIIHDISIRKRAEAELRIAATAFEAQEGIMITDVGGVILKVNKSFTNITGYRAEEIIGKSPHILSSGHHDAEFYRTMWGSIALVGAWEGEIWNRRKSGDIYPEYLVITAVKLVDGTITHYVATFKDITERKQAESELQNAHQQLNLLLDSMAEGAYGVDIHGNCTFVNHSFLQILGYLSQDEVVGHHIHELIHHSHADGAPHPEAACEILSTQRRNEYLHCADEIFWHRLGVPIPVEYWSRPIVNNGVLMGGIVTFIDISERKEAEEKLRYSEQRFRDVSDAAGEYLWELDTNMLYTYVSSRSIDVKGYTPEELMGKSPIAFMPEEDIQNVGHIVKRAIADHKPFKLQHRDITKSGAVVWEEVNGVPIYDKNGDVIGLRGTGLNISERKEIEDQVHQLAFYDPLTSLPNRRLLNDRLSQAMSAGERSGLYGALMFLDLDNFKPLNDAHGHGVGDLLLIEAASRLKKCVRSMDTVARFGGDEFVVMLSELDSDKSDATVQARLVAEKILTALSEPYVLNASQGEEATSVEHHCTASIGVTVFLNHASSQDDILIQADAAMYDAKVAGRNSIRFHEEFRS